MAQNGPETQENKRYEDRIYAIRVNSPQFKYQLFSTQFDYIDRVPTITEAEAGPHHVTIRTAMSIKLQLSVERMEYRLSKLCIG